MCLRPPFHLPYTLYMETVSRMFVCEYVSLLGHGDVGIDFGDVDGAVSEDFLDITDIDVCFQQAGGECVAEHVRCDMRFYGCQGGIFVDHSAYGLVRQYAAGLFDKKMVAGLHFGEKGSFIFFEDVDDGIVSDLDFSFF